MRPDFRIDCRSNRVIDHQGIPRQPDQECKQVMSRPPRRACSVGNTHETRGRTFNQLPIPSAEAGLANHEAQRHGIHHTA